MGFKGTYQNLPDGKMISMFIMIMEYHNTIFVKRPCDIRIQTRTAVSILIVAVRQREILFPTTFLVGF